jgi:hypothetical protein
MRHLLRTKTREANIFASIYGGPSSIAPLRISAFLSYEPKPGKQISIGFFKTANQNHHQPMLSSGTYPKTRGMQKPTHHPLELLEDSEVRAAISVGSGGGCPYHRQSRW